MGCILHTTALKAAIEKAEALKEAKPTMVYNKNGKQHKAVITIKMKFA